MKANIIIRIFFAALFAIGLVAPVQAGPGPHVSYAPVTTMDQAKSIKPGTRIAFRCACGAVKTLVADKEGSYLHGFTCDVCKSKFVVRSDAHGQTHGEFVLENSAGHQATLLQAL